MKCSEDKSSAEVHKKTVKRKQDSETLMIRNYNRIIPSLVPTLRGKMLRHIPRALGKAHYQLASKALTFLNNINRNRLRNLLILVPTRSPQIQTRVDFTGRKYHTVFLMSLF